VDDWDKAASLLGNATPRRSASSFDAAGGIRVNFYGWRQGLVVFSILFAIWLGWNPDTRFESSDGAWWDSTFHFKGRNFEQITEGFQGYQATCKKPQVSLVRTTAITPWAVTSWPWYLLKQEWHVLYRPAQMCGGGQLHNCRPLGGEVVCASGL
jgi:hypothetical protein